VNSLRLRTVYDCEQFTTANSLRLRTVHGCEHFAHSTPSENASIGQTPERKRERKKEMPHNSTRHDSSAPPQSDLSSSLDRIQPTDRSDRLMQHMYGVVHADLHARERPGKEEYAITTAVNTIPWFTPVGRDGNNRRSWQSTGREVRSFGGLEFQELKSTRLGAEENNFCHSSCSPEHSV
jgi:hypothetical protein